MLLLFTVGMLPAVHVAILFAALVDTWWLDMVGGPCPLRRRAGSVVEAAFAAAPTGVDGLP